MLETIKTRIFADGADLKDISALASDARIMGFTTNPSLMRQAGLTEYEGFARRVLEIVEYHPVSFEVCADDAPEMLRQARIISGWGSNVYVKIPISTTSGEPSTKVIRELSLEGVRVNVTAVLTLEQVESTVSALAGEAPAYVSVFAGRIADTGVDPVPVMASALEILNSHSHAELIWASPREVFNVIQADSVGCHIITMTPDLVKKLDLLGKDLEQFSLETVQMFYRDAQDAGFHL